MDQRPLKESEKQTENKIRSGAYEKVKEILADESSASYVFNSRIEQATVDITYGTPEMVEEITRLKRRISRTNRVGGFAYVATSEKQGSKEEVRFCRIIRDSLRINDTQPEPNVVSVDDFYRLFPGQTSIVKKLQILSDKSTDHNPLILSDFTSSKVFTAQVLMDVPTQENAGLQFNNSTESGHKLLEASKILSELILSYNGDLSLVLQNLILKSGGDPNDSRLFIVTALLLKDMQKWQNLWYESKEKGTALFIVAPSEFHNTMNRLNFMWGHGGMDYHYRASNSMGAFDGHVLDPEAGNQNFKKGLSKTEFELRMARIIKALIN